MLNCKVGVCGPWGSISWHKTFLRSSFYLGFQHSLCYFRKYILLDGLLCDLELPDPKFALSKHMLQELFPSVNARILNIL